MRRKDRNILITLGLVVLAILLAPLFLGKPASYIFIDSINAVPPGTNGHLLGTDTLGRDVLAGILSGARISLFVSIVSVLLSLLIAFLLNIGTSYIGDDRIKISPVQAALFCLLFIVSFYYAFIAFKLVFFLEFVIFFILLTLSFFLLKKIGSSAGKQTISVPLDTLGQQFYEFFQSIPKLILLLIFIGLSPKSNLWSLSIIIALLMWPIFYRYIRLEILSEKGKDRFKSLKNLGYSDMRIVFGQFLPGIFPILSTPLIFAVISVIFLEANLSFLGLGIGGDYVSWGNLLAEARRNTSAWWLIVFPGACLFLIFFFLNRWLQEDEELN